MKNLLLPILFMCVFINTKAQEYNEFPKEDARWGYYFYSTAGGFTEEYWDLFYINNDTLIDNKTYHEIKSMRWFTPFDEPVEGVFNFYFREENKKIYIKNYSNEGDHLAYDFNLNINDTFVTYNGDSLVMIDEYEKYGRRALYFISLNLNYMGNPFYQEWVEGIGSTDVGLFSGKYYSSLGCHKFNECDTCSCYDDIITSASKVQPILNLKLSPNPASTYFQLELENANNTISIQNLQGQIVYQEQTSTKNPIINIEHLSKGTYVVLIVDENGKTITGKLIKE